MHCSRAIQRRFLSMSGPRRSGLTSGRRTFKRSVRRHCSWNGKAILRWRSTPTSSLALKRCSQSEGVERGASLVFLCRSGARSRHAAIAMTERGMGALFQCVGWVRRRAGRLAPERRGQRVEGGRVALDADVKRRANPVPRHRRNVGCPPNARDTTMDMYDEPNPDRFDHGGSGGPPFGEAWRRCCDRLRAEVGDAVFNSWFGSLTLEVGRIGAGPAFRSDTLSQELDRDPLRRTCRFGAERRSRTGRANPYFRALVGGARAIDQRSAARLRLARQDGGQAAGALGRSRRRRSPPAEPNARRARRSATP